MRAVLCCVLLAACVTPVGQKVRTLLLDHELSCDIEVEGEAPVARLELAQEADFYLAEVIATANGDALTVPSVRRGSSVVFTCPAGLDALVVRTASVLRSSVDEVADEPVGPGAPP
jgi:hypothetical protein